MIYYKDFDYSKLQYNFTGKGDKVYDDNIYSFDIETTSVFSDGQNVISFDKQYDAEYYNTKEKLGYMYIWQFSINENVVYGRTWNEFRELLKALAGNSIGTIIIYVHNLAFEFQFLRNIINDFEIFARAPLHPIVARSKEFNCEFRCSLMLTQISLAKLSDVYELPIKKMVGDLDYDVCRNSKTPLTPAEMKYCEYDCLVVYELIKKMRIRYKHVCNIPLTQTGTLRRECQKMYSKNLSYHQSLVKQLPDNIKEFMYIMDSFSGGYTHANSFYTGKIINNVHSQDITSSYPTVMIAEQYPNTRFIVSKLNDIDNMRENCSYIIDITFYNIYSVLDNNYLSFSKAKDYVDPLIDNGRISSAKMCRFIVTNVDLEIIKMCYKWERYVINEARLSFNRYLDTDFVKMIIKLYGNKTAFKGLPDKSSEYMQSKQFINSMYGMMVTNLVTDLVEFTTENGWNVVQLTEELANIKLKQIAEDRKTFLSPAWGVFVTAYARRNLWKMIVQLDKDVVYCDTDSVKYINNHDKEFEVYNTEILQKLAKACKFHGIDISELSPKDTKNIEHPLGVFDRENDYKKFVTLGAKKYAYTNKDDEIGITVSGVSKSGASALSSLKQFKKGFVFDYEHSGKKLLTYNDDQSPIILTDVYGFSEERTDKFGINLRPDTYKLGISEDYGNYINMTLHYHDERYKNYGS